ncbi:MAG: hypothetical protein ACI9LM_002859 [Alteromonadaceae bacterium]|jgi:uncharacterized protein YehS (DUF1456 family)
MSRSFLNLLLFKLFQDRHLTNNDILRRIRYTFNFNDQKMIALFALAELTVSREQVSAWLKKDDDADYVNCNDTTLAVFLNGLINDKRGKKDGPQQAPEKRLNNNAILTKLKIALNLKAEDIVDLLQSANLRMGKTELSAFFRKSDHKHFKLCKDQLLRNFLQGIDNKYHVNRPEKYKTVNAPVEPKSEDISAELPDKNYKTASAKASKIYINPNRTAVAKPEATRKVLKLAPKVKPKDIWGE